MTTKTKTANAIRSAIDKAIGSESAQFFEGVLVSLRKRFPDPEILEALQAGIDAGELWVMIFGDSPDSVKIGAGSGETTSAREAVTFLDDLRTACQSRRSKAETQLLKIIRSVACSCVAKIQDVREAALNTGHSLEDLTAGLISLAKRGDVSAEKNERGDVYLFLADCVSSESVKLAEVLPDFLADRFTVTACPGDSVNAGRDGREWHGLTENQALTLAARLEQSGWIVLPLLNETDSRP